MSAPAPNTPLRAAAPFAAMDELSECLALAGGAFTASPALHPVALAAREDAAGVERQGEP